MTLPTIRPDRLTRWHVLAALVLAAIGFVVTWEVWADIYNIATTDEEYSHIFLVPLVVLWLVWVRKMRLRHCKPSFTAIGPITIAFGWGLSLYGFYNGVQFFWHCGAVLVVLGCMLSILGKNVLFRFFPAVAVLIFLVPIPGMLRQKVALPLQSWTAQITQQATEMLGMNTEVFGNTLTVNGETVTVAEACNGLRMVFALILVSYAFSFGMPLRNSVRILVLLASPLAAIFCNVIRTIPTVWLYGYRDASVASTFHDWSGWAMLPIAFGLLYGIIKVLRWAMIPVTPYTLAAQA